LETSLEAAEPLAATVRLSALGETEDGMDVSTLEAFNSPDPVDTLLLAGKLKDNPDPKEGEPKGFTCCDCDTTDVPPEGTSFDSDFATSPNPPNGDFVCVSVVDEFVEPSVDKLGFVVGDRLLDDGPLSCFGEADISIDPGSFDG
jgi:hypothetical protein